MYLKKTYTAGITKEVHNTYSCLLYTSSASACDILVIALRGWPGRTRTAVPRHPCLLYTSINAPLIVVCVATIVAYHKPTKVDFEGILHGQAV